MTRPSNGGGFQPASRQGYEPGSRTTQKPFGNAGSKVSSRAKASRFHPVLPAPWTKSM